MSSTLRDGCALATATLRRRRSAGQSGATVAFEQASRTWLIASGLTLLAGCNSGLFAIGSSSSGTSGNTDAAPVVSSLQVPHSASSPASIYFVVFDQNGDLTDVEVNYRRSASAGFQPITLDSASNPLTGIPSNAAVPYEVLWDFASDFGGVAFSGGVEIEVVVTGGSAPPTLGGLELGNDAPQIVSAEALPSGADEYRGNVDVGFTAFDSGSDVLKIRVEYNDDEAGGFPASSWKLARPASTPLAQPTPAFGITGFEPNPTGVEGTFRWDTAFDLAGFDANVRVRFTPEDVFAAGPALLTSPFRVDNNEAPSATLEEGAFVANPDQLRKIAVPFTLFDLEGDEVRVVLQWRRQGETFPDLPTNPAELDAILPDPTKRKALRIVTEVPFTARGQVDPIDANSVRVPEVAGSASAILNVRKGVAGDELAILRRSPIPRALQLPARTLRSPVAVLPIGDGTRALVLDRGVGGIAWRLQELELATGAVVRTLTVVAGALPSAMVLEQGGKALIVAEQLGNSWQLQRVNLATGATQLLFSSNGSATSVHGLESLSAGAVLVTAGDKLIRVGYDTVGGAQAATLLGDLKGPRGVILDPLKNHRVYLAEQDAPGPGQPGRVRALELDALGENVVRVTELGMSGMGFPRPTALALERGGARVLVITDKTTSDGVRELRGVDLGGSELGEVFEIANDLQDSATGLATGADGLRVLALPAASDLAVGGGIEQKRTIASYDPHGQIVFVTAPFDPAPSGGQQWRWSKRIDVPFDTQKTGASGVLLWDSEDVIGGGEVVLRLTPYDSDQGLAHSSTGAKVIRAPQLGDSFLLATGMDPVDIACADLNGDGLQDLVTANSVSDDLSVFFQVTPGEFSATADLVLGGPGTTGFPKSVAAADLNGDGLPDLVSANRDSGNLALFFQSAPGQYPPAPSLVLGGPTTTAGAEAVAVADLNGDGRLDLVAADRSTSRLSVFFQSAPGQFSRTPDLVLGSAQVASASRFVRVADVDGDGLLDLVTSNPTGRRLNLFFQVNAGVFATTPVTAGGALADPGISSVGVGDLDGDGLLDLVTANNFDFNNGNHADGNNLTVFFQTGPRVFPAAPDFILPAQQPNDIEVADLDGDGLLDLLSSTEISAEAVVFLQSSRGEFQPTPSLRLDTPGSFASSLAIADLDGDGQLDIAVANRNSNDVTVQLQFRAGQFSATPEIALPFTDQSGAGTVTGDLNGDGLPDLVTALSFIDNTLLVRFQRQPGQYPSNPDLVLGGPTTTDAPFGLAIADLNADGLPDLVSANRLGRNLTVFLQSDSNPDLFSQTPDLVLGGPSLTRNPTCLAVADLNNDDRPDLVASNGPGGDNLTIFFQTKFGSFPDVPDLTLGNVLTTESATCVATVDLNGDGLTDIASANRTGNSLTVFFQSNSSPGQYSLTPDLTLGSQATTNWPVSVAGADLNADGLLDLVSANNQSHQLAIFFQTSPGQFNSTPDVTLGSFTTTPFPNHVRVADLDGDGLVDVITSDGGGRLKIFLQLSPGRFPPSPSYEPQGVGGFGGIPHVADVNSDGQLDLLVSGGGLSVFIGK